MQCLSTVTFFNNRVRRNINLACWILIGMALTGYPGLWNDDAKRLGEACLARNQVAGVALYSYKRPIEARNF